MTAATATTTNQIKPQFKIVNNGSYAVPLGELEIRYYFTRDTAQPMTFNCDYAGFGCNNIIARFVPVTPPRTGSDYYLSLTFNGAAGNLNSIGTSGPIQTRFNKNDWSNFDQSNDYSFDASKIAFADWSKVTLYRNGILVWGTEP